MVLIQWGEEKLNSGIMSTAAMLTRIKSALLFQNFMFVLQESIGTPSRFFTVVSTELNVHEQENAEQDRRLL